VGGDGPAHGSGSHAHSAQPLIGHVYSLGIEPSAFVHERALSPSLVHDTPHWRQSFAYHSPRPPMSSGNRFTGPA
jgi:hypothetical protein